jgi:hypothetical protein
MNKLENNEKKYKFKLIKTYYTMNLSEQNVDKELFSGTSLIENTKYSNSKIIHIYNNKYCIKEYSLEYINIELFINILIFLQTTKKLPKTIYKSYYFTENIYLFKKYILRTSLPNTFIIKNKNLFELFSSKYKLNQKIYELAKYNKCSFKNFIKKINNNENISNEKRIDILYSLLNQGLMTLFWLYMKKGIVHNNLNYDNFYVIKTNKSFIKINIEDYNNIINLSEKLFIDKKIFLEEPFTRKNIENHFYRCIDSSIPFEYINKINLLDKEIFYKKEIKNTPDAIKNFLLNNLELWMV